MAVAPSVVELLPASRCPVLALGSANRTWSACHLAGAGAGLRRCGTALRMGTRPASRAMRGRRWIAVLCPCRSLG